MRTGQALLLRFGGLRASSVLWYLRQDAHDFYGDKFYDTGYMFTLP